MIPILKSSKILDNCFFFSICNQIDDFLIYLMVNIQDTRFLAVTLFNYVNFWVYLYYTITKSLELVHPQIVNCTKYLPHASQQYFGQAFEF